MIQVIDSARKFFRPKKVVLFGGLLFVVMGLVGALVYYQSHKVNAEVGTDWNAGNIISDSQFYNNNAMSVQDIQTFLNQKVPTCDTNGTQMYNSTMTNAQYAATQGWPGPAYVCLKDYYQVPRSDQIVSNLTTNVIPAGAISAAQIIKNAADTYGINPQVLLVTIQKESLNLLNDNWPLPSQYTAAMGYDCTDSAPCDPQYAGFYNQVTSAARQFSLYKNNPTNYRYQPLQTNSILFSPNTSCGASNVYIQDYATAGLYNYTPYQPDQAALNNLYGTGDACSSYGNRNFWRDFTDWFNSISTLQKNLTMNVVSQPDTTPARGETVSYTVSFTNNLPYDVTVDGIGIVGRLGNISTGANRDFGWQGPVTLKAGVTQQYTFTTTIQDMGTLYAWPAIYYEGGYIQYNSQGVTLNPRLPNLTLSAPLSTNVSTIYTGQNVTFTATVKNNEAVPIAYDSLGIPVKDSNYTNFDATWTTGGALAPGQTITLSGVSQIGNPGAYSYWVADYYDGTYTTIGSTQQLNALKIAPNFSVSGLTLSSATPVLLDNITGSFTVTNNLPVGIDVDAVGIVGRYGTFNGPNRDIGWQGPVHFNAGETKTFSGYSRQITDLGTHYYWVGILYQGSYLQYNNWGSTVVSTAPSFSVSGLTLSSATPAVGDTLTGSFTVTNNLSTPIDVDAVGIVGRYGTFNGPNRDIGWQGPVHFNAGETKTFSGYSRQITDLGTSYYWIGILHQGVYLQYNNWGSTVVSH